MSAPESTDDPSDRLDRLARGRAATIVAVRWHELRPSEAQRMRELGFDEGVTVEKLHAAPLGQDPIAVRVGRMTIAIRRAQAAAVLVSAIGTMPAQGLAVAAE